MLKKEIDFCELLSKFTTLMNHRYGDRYVKQTLKFRISLETMQSYSSLSDNNKSWIIICNEINKGHCHWNLTCNLCTGMLWINPTCFDYTQQVTIV